MMFNVPLPGGTTGHAVGGPLIAVALGPAAAVIAVSTALAIQALLFGDGGVLAIAANSFNLALVVPLVGYAVYSALAFGTAPASTGRRIMAAAAGAYAGDGFGALTTAVMLGIQPALEPGHCPYDLRTTVPAMVVPHLLVVGFVEAMVTAGPLLWLARRAAAGGKGARAAHSGSGSLARPGAAAPTGKAWAVIGLLCLASPLGLLAAGGAWGEDAEVTPPFFWRAPFADYHPGLGLGEGPAYVVAALAGVSAIAMVVFAGGFALSRLRPKIRDKTG
jgi:cobalt/nickel transport system permease protein